MYLIRSLSINFVLASIFLVKLLIPANQTRNFIVSVVTCPFQAFVLPDQFVYMGITLMDLHLQGIDVFPQLSDGSSVDIDFGPDLISKLLNFTFDSVFFGSQHTVISLRVLNFILNGVIIMLDVLKFT